MNFFLSHGKELFLVGETATEYENALEQYKYAPINLIDWIVYRSQYNKNTLLIKFLKWLKYSPPNTTLPPADVN